MERLKSILADKILDLSASSGDEVKAKIDKIQRFRDFANALKSLMVKYPAIEDELIEMVNDGDFDTKIASSRVDTVIRLADAETAQINKTVPVNDKAENKGKDTDSVYKEIAEEIIDEEVFINPDDIPMEIYAGEGEQVYQPEETDDENIESEYIPFENVDETSPEPATITEQITEKEINTEPIQTISITTGDENIYPSEEEIAAAKRKVTIRRVVQILGIILVIAALIFIIKFVMVHWKTILIVAGILLALAILITWLVKRKR